MKLKSKSLHESANTLIEGIIKAYKNCPDSSNKTFEEVANWAGKHIVINEIKQK